uniref:ATP synthase complex subunit 8 n=1 Tax=Haloveloides sundaensis TaxID=3095933 RepID=A0AB38Z6U9_9HEMI|nr:ATP synthase F0 subunit 8 [Haloveloides sundaensis]WPW47168.1 ATP synthase F0 subunit 8 [Haloveloides sundaensis]
MPQMAPLAWLKLMIMFSIMLIIVNTMLYFNKNYQIKPSSNKIMTNNSNWKW